MSKKKDKTPKECKHDWIYEDDEYGSLADGGSYEIYRCSKCRQKHYCPLPD